MRASSEIAEAVEPVGGERLTPGAATETSRVAGGQTPTSAVAVSLLSHARPGRTLLHLASSERRAEEIGRGLSGLHGGIEVFVFPAWDCLPYDRASPSRDIMGRRLSVQKALASPSAAPRIVVTSPEAIVQRTPPLRALQDAFFTLSVGQVLDRHALELFASRTGYVVDDRIDEPGEIAFLGEVVDIFPADAAQPVRIVLATGDVVAEIRLYDPATQRSEELVPTVSLGPASELIASPDGAKTANPTVRGEGCEHRLSEHYGKLTNLLELLSNDCLISRDAKTNGRLRQLQSQILEAHEAQTLLGRAEDAAPLPPAKSYLLGAALTKALNRFDQLTLDVEVEEVARPAGAKNPGRAFCEIVQSSTAAGHRVVLTGLGAELRALARALDRGLGRQPTPAENWGEVERRPAGAVMALKADFETGFINRGANLCVIAASDVLGGRLAARRSSDPTALLLDPDLRIGDVVLHEDHGIAVLRDLKRIEVGGVLKDALELEYEGQARLLAGVDEIGKIWRYGAEEDAVTLDRLSGQGWPKRRAEVSRYIDEAAVELVKVAQARSQSSCAPIRGPKAAYARFAARFNYPETPDQAAAILAVTQDLASGRPMDRLVCGDVGFGKTEVALRAAAIVALSGRQVAIAAPTTVLARQHFETISHRFAGTGVRVAQLSRLVDSAEAKAVRTGLADGSIGVVVGTHALAGKEVSFADLGLMIIDEEQKFGAGMKRALRDLSADGHRLSLTATPIPRTLQAALVGIQEVSIIASPPARRRPIRTFLAPFDAATLRTALLREKRRGGQSFIVTPRIEDIAPMTERLASLAPELTVAVAHGELPAHEVDEVMVRFAAGEGDILLATNIIESGLDVPQANSMFIWRPDRFGLSQLHQLRGRVGRGRVQGVAYLLTDPDAELTQTTRARLSTLEAFDRLGSGLAISARDLDLRGGGDLMGEEQAGHMKMIGAALYQRLLARAMQVASGGDVEDAGLPALKLSGEGSFPDTYVPDPVTRINLYARLSRLQNLTEIDSFEEELEDRFGVPPSETTILLAMARLQHLARGAGVRQVSAGPKGLALSLTPEGLRSVASRLDQIPEARLVEDRLVVAASQQTDTTKLGAIERLLTLLSI